MKKLVLWVVRLIYKIKVQQMELFIAGFIFR
jgi:hypothetical protein